MFPNYAIFGGHLCLLSWKQGSARNILNIFLLTKTRSTVLANKIALAIQFKNKSYPCGVSSLKSVFSMYIVLLISLNSEVNVVVILYIEKNLHSTFLCELKNF